MTNILLVLLCIGVVGACVLAWRLSSGKRASQDMWLCNVLKAGDTNVLEEYFDSGGKVDRLIPYRPHASAPMLHLAIDYGQVDAVAYLLRKGANPNQGDSRGRTPLTWVIGEAPNQRILTVLLNAGADPDVKESSPYGWTPLILAATLGDVSTISLLLDSGANVNATSNNGETALHHAANAAVARTLVDCGADLNARTQQGNTPVDAARILGRYDVLVVLTNAAARANHPGPSIAR